MLYPKKLQMRKGDNYEAKDGKIHLDHGNVDCQRNVQCDLQLENLSAQSAAEAPEEITDIGKVKYAY